VQLNTEFLPREFGAVGAFVRDGMLVAGVIPGTPADALGLQRWDLIARIDNRHITSARDLQAVMNESGGVIALLVKKRNGRPARLLLDLVTNPLGAWFESSLEGARITGVLPGSPAELAGLQRGDILGQVDDRPVRTAEELSAVLRGARNPATVVVRRAATGQLSRLVMDLAW
jgi:serine protease Do